MRETVSLTVTYHTGRERDSQSTSNLEATVLGRDSEAEMILFWGASRLGVIILALLTSIHGDEHNNDQVTEPAAARADGDIIIGGLFPIHEWFDYHYGKCK